MIALAADRAGIWMSVALHGMVIGGLVFAADLVSREAPKPLAIAVTFAMSPLEAQNTVGAPAVAKPNDIAAVLRPAAQAKAASPSPAKSVQPSYARSGEASTAQNVAASWMPAASAVSVKTLVVLASISSPVTAALPSKSQAKTKPNVAPTIKAVAPIRRPPRRPAHLRTIERKLAISAVDSQPAVEAPPAPHRTIAAPSNVGRKAEAQVAVASAPSTRISPPRFSGGGLANRPPRYPLQARRRGIEGRVVLRVSVTVGGQAKAVTVHQSSGYAMLDRAAKAAVVRWRFQPATQAGKPVPGTVDAPVAFRLK
jgi:protein TonB